MASYISPKVKNRFSQTSGRGLSAVEEISKGEIVADYTNGTGEYIDTEKSDELFEKCNCGFLKCRGVVTGNDWKTPELQNRYSGYFSGYLQEKIDKFH